MLEILYAAQCHRLAAFRPKRLLFLVRGIYIQIKSGLRAGFLGWCTRRRVLSPLTLGLKEWNVRHELA